MFKSVIPLLRVTTAAGVEKFYCEALGFRILSVYRLVPEKVDPAYIVLRRDGAALHVSSFPGDGLIGHVVTITVDDVEALLGDLVSKGIDTGNGLMKRDWGNREIYVRDPDGNAIRFQAP